MKAYLSYSHLGYTGEPGKMLVDLHKICAFYLKKNFGEAHLITDSKSKPHFDHIPWDSVSTELDQVPPDYPHVWSLSKLYAFREIARKGEPFVHSDNDVILWKGLPERLRNAEVFAQQPENVYDYRYEPDKFYANCPNRHVFEVVAPVLAFNVGIFGGNNTAFIHEYASAAIAFVLDPANSWFWKEYNGYWSWWCKATLAEQWFLSAYAMFKGIKIETLFPKWPSQEDAKSVCYTHLMAKKRTPDVQAKISNFADRIIRAGNQLINLGFDEALLA